jgi:phage protein D
MNLEERTREWVDITDVSVAKTIFNSYGITPAVDNGDDNDDSSPSHTEAGHSLMQRASDIQFLRHLARRNGKLCRVVGGRQPGQRIGYFAKPNLDEKPVVTLKLNELETWNVRALDCDWDVTKPTAVKVSQALFNDPSPDGVSADTDDFGLTRLGDRSLAEFTGKPMTVLLTAPVDHAGELQLRAQSLLREASWFAHCQGEADVARLNRILRVGTVVLIEGIGRLNSGKYYVWSVRHTITADSHTMKFTLARNAVGPALNDGGGSPGGLV